MRVLVADDDADTGFSLKLLLERAGYEIEIASNGARALQVQVHRPVDVLITDIFMPDVDGLETIERFRRDFPEVKIIAISGGAGSRANGKSYLQTASIAGADAVLGKPFGMSVLLQTLLRIMPGPKSRAVGPRALRHRP